MIYTKKTFLILLMSFSLYACQSMPERDGGLNPEQISVLQKNGFQLASDEDAWAFDLAVKMLFEFDSDTIREEQGQEIIALIRELLDVGIEQIRLDGHTDNIGEPQYNIELSLRRAESVARLAVEAGMSAEKVTTRGHGDAKPVEDNSTERGRSENRRVVIIVSNY